MANVFEEKGIKPDLIYSSTAERALEFAKVIAEILDFKKKKIVSTKDLYMADVKEMLGILRSVEDSAKTVFMVSHNPYITEFANSLCNYDLDNIAA